MITSLTVYSYYQRNKITLVKLFFLSLFIGLLEIIGIFAIIPYVEIMFGGEVSDTYNYLADVEYLSFLQNKTYITLIFLSFYLIKPIVLAGLIYKLQKTVGQAHTKLLSDIFSKSFDVDVYSKEKSSNHGRVILKRKAYFFHLTRISKCLQIFLNIKCIHSSNKNRENFHCSLASCQSGLALP